jgi:hypothetical protein
MVAPAASSPFFEPRTLQDLLAADRLALADLLRAYLLLNAPRPLPLPESLTALADLKRDPFWNETFITTACLRWAFRVVWDRLFGGAGRTPEAEDQFAPLPMTLNHERAAFDFLMREGRESSDPPPAPFESVLARWLAGDPPPIPRSDEEGRLVRGSV